MRKLGVFIFSLGLLCSNYESHCFKAIGRIVKGVTKPVEHVVRGVGKGIEGVGRGAGKVAESVVRNGYKHAKKAGVSVGGQVNGNGNLNSVNVSAGKMANGQYVFNFSSDMQSTSPKVSRPPLFGDEVVDWKERQIVREGVKTRSERLSYLSMLKSTNRAVQFHGFDTAEVKRSILQKGTQTLYRYQYNYTDFLLSGNGSDKGYSFKTGYKMPENRTFFDNFKTDAERIASQSFIFEKTGLNWSFNLEFINGKEYHRAHCDGLRDILVPVGKRYIIWSMDRKLNPNSSFVSEMSKYMPQCPNALKTEDRPKIKEAVYNTCASDFVKKSQDLANSAGKIFFETLVKSDPKVVNKSSGAVYSDVVRRVDCYESPVSSFENFAKAFDHLEKGSEISHVGISKFLQENTGLNSDVADKISKISAINELSIYFVPEQHEDSGYKFAKLVSTSSRPGNAFKFEFEKEAELRELRQKPVIKGPSDYLEIAKNFVKAVSESAVEFGAELVTPGGVENYQKFKAGKISALEYTNFVAQDMARDATAAAIGAQIGGGLGGAAGFAMAGGGSIPGIAAGSTAGAAIGTAISRTGTAISRTLNKEKHDSTVLMNENHSKSAGGSERVVEKVLSAPAMQRHHIFPRQFKDYFSKKGINIDEHCVDLSRKTHLSAVHGTGNCSQMPGRWNQRWEAFIDSHPNATSEEVFKFAGKMLDEFGLNNCKIVNYK